MEKTRLLVTALRNNDRIFTQILAPSMLEVHDRLVLVVAENDPDLVAPLSTYLNVCRTCGIVRTSHSTSQNEIAIIGPTVWM